MESLELVFRPGTAFTNVLEDFLCLGTGDDLVSAVTRPAAFGIFSGDVRFGAVAFIAVAKYHTTIAEFYRSSGQRSLSFVCSVIYSKLKDGTK
jgi:hypothetical protein